VALYGDETSERRIGIITGKRVGCSAVRNRVRRRLREVYRKNRRFARKDGWLVLIARSSARLATYQDLVSEFLTLLSRC
jgi:ribonuclease P protein component